WYEDCAGMVVSTTPHRTGPTVCAEGSYYARTFGTSGAAPHVSGVAALLVSTGASAERIEDCILRSADDLGPEGRDPLFGYGRLNARRAVACARRT
ncbi:MAG: S8 family serine peptidase, partial [Actinomycetota bacterium]|nr:S8 family serine peptidase [Actinomycetota bacterium]